MLILEKIIFYLLIFCLPFQTRTILYEWSADFNEWTSAFLYFTDLLIITLLIFWFWRLFRTRNSISARGFKKERFLSKKTDIILILFLLTALISLSQAKNPQLGFYQWMKLLEFVLFFFYIKYNFTPRRTRSGAGFRFERIAQIFIVSGLFQSIIAISQYSKQASLGFWWFGESPLAPNIIGAAKIVVDGIKMIRAYGAFPHPNILAAFLLISLFFLYELWLRDKPRTFRGLRFAQENNYPRKVRGEIHYGLLAGIFGILFFALFLTFSRTIISVFLLVSLLYFIFLFKKFKKKIIYLFILFFVLCSLFAVSAWPEISYRFSSSLTDQAVDLRVSYNQAAFSIIKNHPFLGVGLGNFVWQIREIFDSPAWLFQPVHNIYLLIASETGLMGLVLFLLFVFGVLKRFKEQRTTNSEQCYSLTFIVLCLLFIAFFDHFFWTLQQGQLMLWVLLGMLASFDYKPRAKFWRSSN